MLWYKMDELAQNGLKRPGNNLYLQKVDENDQLWLVIILLILKPHTAAHCKLKFYDMMWNKWIGTKAG